MKIHNVSRYLALAAASLLIGHTKDSLYSAEAARGVFLPCMAVMPHWSYKRIVCRHVRSYGSICTRSEHVTKMFGACPQIILSTCLKRTQCILYCRPDASGMFFVKSSTRPSCFAWTFWGHDAGMFRVYSNKLYSRRKDI